MKAFELAQVLAEHARSERAYLEFVREPSLSVGIYVVPTNGTDTQQPHAQDEVYYVLAGRGRVAVGDEDRPIQAGSIIFVAAGVPHYFYDVSEDVRLLVFFAPAESAATEEPSPTG
jgi:mannose-6-phosphate isomerase-like protein (cupin superfamily)